MLSSWDKIVETGKQVYEKSGGKIALLDDVESVLQLYASYKGQAWVDETTTSLMMSICLRCTK